MTGALQHGYPAPSHDLIASLKTPPPPTSKPPFRRMRSRKTPTEPGPHPDRSLPYRAGDWKHEENLPTEPSSSEAEPRLPSANEDQGGSRDPQTPSGEGSKASYRLDRHEVAVASVAGRFGRSERLRRSREFQRVSREGQRAATQHFVLLRAPAAARPPGLRLGVTVSRAVGNSVARNRVKRVIREWFRIVGKNLEGLGDSDLVIIARRGAATVAGGAMLVELDALARRAGEAAD